MDASAIAREICCFGLSCLQSSIRSHWTLMVSAKQVPIIGRSLLSDVSDGFADFSVRNRLAITNLSPSQLYQGLSVP